MSASNNIPVTVTEDMFNDALKGVIVRQLSTSEQIQEWIADAVEELTRDGDLAQEWFRDVVRAEVLVQAPGNPRFQNVIQGVRDHLDRYPAIQHDRGLQEAVGKAIFEYLQGKF